MSILGLPYPYLPCTLIWTKKSLDKFSSVYPTYLPQKFGHFGIKVCSYGRCQKHPEGGRFLVCGGGYKVFSIFLGGVQTISSSLQDIEIIFRIFRGDFGILHTFTSMDIHIGPTYLKSFCPNFFFEKVWLRNTLPSFNVKNFLFFFNALLRKLVV